MNYQTALISGASSGIGEATAIALAQLGVRLILLARRAEKLQSLAASLAEFTECHTIVCDVRDTKQLAEHISQLPPLFTEVDILVNNAGLALGLAPAHQSDWQDWQTMIETNCTALAFMTHALLPGMVV